MSATWAEPVWRAERTMHLPHEELQVLVALQEGQHLKVHRTPDGIKRYRLHRVDGSVAEEVNASVAGRLERSGLIESNMKFPVATFLLTEKGNAAAFRITGSRQKPTGPRGTC